MELKYRQTSSIQQKAHNNISYSGKRLTDVADYCKGEYISIDNGSGMYNEFILEEVELCNRHLICKCRTDAYNNSIIHRCHSNIYKSITDGKFYRKRSIKR